jgi:hypothetical protein
MKRTAVGFLLFLVSITVLPAQTTVFRSDGRLPAGDQVSYELRVPRGSNVTVRVASVDFQPVIEVVSGGEGSSSFGSQGGAVASTQVGDSDQLRVIVRSETASGGGHFLIRVDRREPPEPIGIPSDLEGSLDAFDMVYGDRGSYIDWYRLELDGQEGRVAVSARSAEFDTFLVARLPNGEELTNDDAAGSDSVITFRSMDGVVEVGVTSYAGEASGAYTLTAREVGEPSRIEVGETLQQTLSGEGLPMRTYLLEGEAGEAVEISLSSGEFDTVLEVVGPDGRELRNDDAPGGMGTDSRLLYVFTSQGDAEITVSSFGGETGSFRLTVQRDPRLDDYRELPQGAKLEAGTEVTQMLGPGDPIDDQGSFYQEFTIEAEADELVELLLRSVDFDAFLEVTAPDGSIYSDDDSAGGTDSRVTFQAPVSGEYAVRATSYFGDGTGLFTLEYNPQGNGGTQASGTPGSAGDGGPEAGVEIASGGRNGGELLLRFQGRLTAENGEPENVHLFQGRQGDMIRVSLRSQRFTPRFELRGPTGHFIASASGSADEASLSLRLPGDGEYTIVCGSESEEAEGPYEASVFAQ